MMKLQENSKQLSFLIICFSQKPTFEVLSTNLKTLTANKLYFLVQLIIRGGSSEPNEPPLDPPLCLHGQPKLFRPPSPVLGFSSTLPRFNLLGPGTVSRDFLFSHFHVLSSAFLSSVLQSLNLCLLQVSHF